MGQKWKILLLEDSKTDAEFIKKYIEEENIIAEFKRVETEEDFQESLKSFLPDLILSDYHLPSYDGLRAVKYIQEHHPNIPVIIVSGVIGEEKAIELLHYGVKDYIFKDKLSKLPTSINRLIFEIDEIRRRKEAEKKLKENEERFRLLIENSPMCIHEIDLEGKVLSMNRAGLDMLALKEEKEVIGISYLSYVHKDDLPNIKGLLEDAKRGKTHHFEFKSSGNDPQYFKSCFVPLSDSNGKIIKLMGITEDITEKKLKELDLIESERHFRELADFDPLTYLPNRRLLYDRLRQTMKASHRSGKYSALMFIDLDNFKPLNDNYGHSAGDALLVETSKRIIECVREIDTVSRYGGDEFIVILSELDTDVTPTIQKAETVARKIKNEISKPFHIEFYPSPEEYFETLYNLTASIGIVIFGREERDYENILKFADQAMYEAKSEGRNRICFFKKNYIDQF